jgi:hypothetical protein
MAPPPLVFGRADCDEDPRVVACVPDRQLERSATPPSGEAKQHKPPTEYRVKGRMEQRPHERVHDAVEHPHRPSTSFSRIVADRGLGERQSCPPLPDA